MIENKTEKGVPMRLSELKSFYSNITIQCHDNPDADAIASAYGLFCFFRDLGLETQMIYSGNYQIQKPNLKLMLEKLAIPIQYVREKKKVKGMLVTVDCQYGAGNVTRFWADAIAVIDHHQPEVEEENLEPHAEIIQRIEIINPGFGSCSTLVWSLLKEESYPIQSRSSLATALYCGLFSDTSQFTELYHPCDLEMKEELMFDREFFYQYKNSNLTLEELQIAGLALQKYQFHEEFSFAIISSQPCDPNILGMISDFLLQVDGVTTCVVYNHTHDGYKFSVRSCSRKVKASELAQYLTDEIGTGGGHYEKAGGFIHLKFLKKKYGHDRIEEYFNERIKSFFYQAG